MIKTWRYGHSYYTTDDPDDDRVHFECRNCGKNLDNLTSRRHHCWECSSKYCDDCWGYNGLNHVCIKEEMADSPIYVGLSQAAKTFYHKASNGNVSIMRLANPMNWAGYSLKCNKCQEEKFIDDKLMLKIAIVSEIEEFCAEHQHNDWVEYKMTVKASKPIVAGDVVTISKEEYLKLKGNVSKPVEEMEGRRFRREDE